MAHAIAEALQSARERGIVSAINEAEKTRTRPDDSSQSCKKWRSARRLALPLSFETNR
jgi:hypothetical protein